MKIFSKKGLTNGVGFSIIAKHLAGRTLPARSSHRREAGEAIKIFEKSFKKVLTKRGRGGII